MTRGDYFDHQPEGDIADFWYAVLPRIDAINEWLNSLHASPTASMHFIYFLKAHSEAWQPTEEEKEELKRRQAKWAHGRALKEAVTRGVQAFSEQDYPAVVQILEPFEKELGPVAMGKLRFARKKLMG